MAGQDGSMRYASTEASMGHAAAARQIFAGTRPSTRRSCADGTPPRESICGVLTARGAPWRSARRRRRGGFLMQRSNLPIDQQGALDAGNEAPYTRCPEEPAPDEPKNEAMLLMPPASDPSSCSPRSCSRSARSGVLTAATRYVVFMWHTELRLKLQPRAGRPSPKQHGNLDTGRSPPIREWFVSAASS